MLRSHLLNLKIILMKSLFLQFIAFHLIKDLIVFKCYKIFKNDHKF